MLQIKKTIRGDWYSSCVKDLVYLNIKLTLEELKNITLKKFTRTLNTAISKKAFEYLLLKRGSKGSEISYTCLKMADYLLPSDSAL